jgi:hypothetical protein
MAHRKVPRFEPEVIAAAANKQAIGDEKVATTSLKSLDIDGVSLSSRYGKAGEYDAMAAMIEGVSPELRCLIESVWCDSNAGACYSVTLKSCTRSQARDVADALEASCVKRNGGHNGMGFSGPAGGSLDLDPYWVGEELL